MKVKRTVKMDVDTFKVSDIIKFKLTDGEKSDTRNDRACPAAGNVFLEHAKAKGSTLALAAVNAFPAARRRRCCSAL